MFRVSWFFIAFAFAWLCVSIHEASCSPLFRSVTSPAASSQTPPASQAIAPTVPHPAVVRVLAAERNAQSAGSGTLVDVRQDCGLVITNWHVVRDATGEIRVIFPNGFQSPARVLKVDKDWDLAALAIWRPGVNPVTVSREAPQRGEPLMIAGYGSGDYRAVVGRCIQYVSPGAKFPMEMVELSAQARQGDSGGPIFNQRGELAGVLFGASRGTTCGSVGGRVCWFLSSLVPDIGSSRADMTNVASHPTNPGVPSFQANLAQSGPAALAPSAPPVPTNDALANSSSTTNNPATNATSVMESHISIQEPEPVRVAARPNVNGDLVSPSRPVPPQPIVAPSRWDESRADAPSVLPGDWQKLLGQTPLEQGKSALAGLGIFFILSALFRRTSGA